MKKKPDGYVRFLFLLKTGKKIIFVEKRARFQNRSEAPLT